MTREKNGSTNKVQDQYTEYERLPVLLKRFSFFEKMRISNMYSSRAILFCAKNNRHPLTPAVLPWCIETFAMLSIEAAEYNNCDFRGHNENKAIKMHDAIWNATSTFLQRPCGRFSIVDSFLPLTALTQFQSQESPWLREYRYWWIFNNNSAPLFLKDIFFRKMGADYEDFLLLGKTLQLLFLTQAENKNISIPEKTLQYLLQFRFPNASKKLLITREDYVIRQQEYTKNDPDPLKYVYSLRPSIQHPFIEYEEKIYFPLPHLLVQSVTSALLYRITENDNSLRSAIGKNIWEKYLHMLISDAGVYSEVFSEQSYKKNGSAAESPDVLARQGKEVLFLENKSTVPSNGLRILDADAYERNINLIASYMVQLYNQICAFNAYNPFSADVSNNIEDYWGIVVLLEDSYIRRHYYYEKARSLLGLDEHSFEWNWFLNHIKIAGLYEVERISLSGKSLIEACKQVFKNDPYTFAFIGYPENEWIATNKNFLLFKREYDQKVYDLLTEMEHAGLFKQQKVLRLSSSQIAL